MRRRTEARMFAVQALYQLDLRGAEFMEELGSFLASSTSDEEVRTRAGEMVRGLHDRLDEVDAVLATAAEHWDISRMAAVDRAILRLGVYELLHCVDVPPKVAVDEAIKLAKRFSAKGSGAFVNGILDHILTARFPAAKSAPR